MNLTEHSLQAGNKQITYYLNRKVRSKKRWYLKLVIKEGKVLVYASKAVKTEEIKNFIRNKSNWIEDKLARWNTLVKNSYELNFESGGNLPFMGESYTVTIKTSVILEKIDIEIDKPGKRVIITLPHTVNLLDLKNKESESFNLTEKALIATYKESISQFIQLEVDRLTKKIQVSYNKIKIKTLKSAWGTCTPLNTLNFNWRLILTPEEIIRYVVVHEVCHLKHRNHSKLFWKEVSRHYPSYKEARKWLTKHNILLQNSFSVY